MYDNYYRQSVQQYEGTLGLIEHVAKLPDDCVTPAAVRDARRQASQVCATCSRRRRQQLATQSRSSSLSRVTTDVCDCDCDCHRLVPRLQLPSDSKQEVNVPDGALLSPLTTQPALSNLQFRSSRTRDRDRSLSSSRDRSVRALLCSSALHKPVVASPFNFLSILLYHANWQEARISLHSINQNCYRNVVMSDTSHSYHGR